jgi:hypothetical protein
MVLLASQAGLPALNDEVKAPCAFKRCAAQIAHPKAACTDRGLASEFFVTRTGFVAQQASAGDEGDFENLGYKSRHAATYFNASAVFAV